MRKIYRLAAVLALAHAHRAPRWVNYLVAALATGGLAALAWFFAVTR